MPGPGSAGLSAARPRASVRAARCSVSRSRSTFRRAGAVSGRRRLREENGLGRGCPALHAALPRTAIRSSGAPGAGLSGGGGAWVGRAAGAGAVTAALLTATRAWVVAPRGERLPGNVGLLGWVLWRRCPVTPACSRRATAAGDCTAVFYVLRPSAVYVVHHVNTRRLNWLCWGLGPLCLFLGAAVKHFLHCCSAILLLMKLLGYMVTYSLCRCKGRRGITGRNLTDVIGGTTVSLGEEILERGYACGTWIAQNQNQLKL